MKKIIITVLALLLLLLVFFFFMLQMERNDLLHLRDETVNHFYPLENRIFSLAEEANHIGIALGDFRPLEIQLLGRIGRGKEDLLKEQELAGKIETMQKLYADVALLLEHTERYPDLFRERDFVKRVDGLHASLEQLRLSIKRYNNSVTAYQTRLQKPMAKMVAKREKLAAPASIVLPRTAAARAAAAPSESPATPTPEATPAATETPAP